MAAGLHSLTVENFRILGDVEEVQLGRVNVLVGPNGSGKSTLLRVIQFLGDAARANLGDAIGQHGGIERLFTRRKKTRGSSKIRIHVKAVVTSHAHVGALDEYTLAFHPVRIAHARASAGVFHTESFKFKRTARQGRRITLENGHLSLFDEGRKQGQRQLTLDQAAFGLAVLPQLGPDEGGNEIRKFQELFTRFRVFDVDAEAARRPWDVRDASHLRPNASNLASFLKFLHEKHARVFEALLSDAREIVPGLKDVEFRAVGGATAAVAVDIVDERLPGATPLADASFGTVRALAMLAMLHDPHPPLVTCVEEIDHGFHPHVFDRLVELLRVASARTQFLIATHSPALVNRLDPSELIVCERDPETGLARIPAVDPDAVARIHDASAYGLGELWFSGTLGGVPR